MGYLQCQAGMHRSVLRRSIAAAAAVGLFRAGDRLPGGAPPFPFDLPGCSATFPCRACPYPLPLPLHTMQCGTWKAKPFSLSMPFCLPDAVWDMESEGLFSREASSRGGRSVYETLIHIFDAAYDGNRAPVPLFVHGAWLQENVQDVAQFVGKPLLLHPGLSVLPAGVQIGSSYWTCFGAE